MKTVPPAKGLTKLTWRQVEELDAKISSLCAHTQSLKNDEEVHLPIVIRNGKPVRIGQPMLMEKFSPTSI
ncbi:MAG: hypothetical protein KDJ52_00280 [Anaerolineae bacterium]|nr:hypothetical protein [Anaerolineae bacterium]